MFEMNKIRFAINSINITLNSNFFFLIGAPNSLQTDLLAGIDKNKSGRFLLKKKLVNYNIKIINRLKRLKKQNLCHILLNMILIFQQFKMSNCLSNI